MTIRKLLQLSKREVRMEIVETESRERFGICFRINLTGFADVFDVRVKKRKLGMSLRTFA